MKNRITIALFLAISVGAISVFVLFGPKIWGEIAYPLKYPEEIKKSAQEFNLDPNLVCAIIFTESRFNVGSESGAGARGLMQIMPATGASIAKTLGVTNYDLHDPATSIRFGSYYISGMLGRYNGNLDLALAGYNAGSGRTDRYMRGESALPYETVSYIQKVKNVRSAYEEIYGQWYAKPEVKKPNLFYEQYENVQDIVRKLILGY